MGREWLKKIDGSVGPRDQHHCFCGSFTHKFNHCHHDLLEEDRRRASHVKVWKLSSQSATKMSATLWALIVQLEVTMKLCVDSKGGTTLSTVREAQIRF